MPIKVGGLYLLIRTDFHRLNEYIYKIGRSSNLYNRLNSYPRQSHLYLLVFCDDKNLCEHESNMIKLFQQNYKLEKDHGNEYFSGNLETMINEIIKYSETNMNKYSILKLVNGLNITSDKSLLLEYMTNINYINKPDKPTKPVKSVKSVEPVPITNCNTITPTEKKFRCSCGKSFIKPFYLKRHQSSINPCIYIKQIRLTNSNNGNNETEKGVISNSIICDICNKKICDKYKLKRHQITCKQKYNLINNTSNYNIPILEEFESILYDNYLTDIDKINKMKEKIDY